MLSRLKFDLSELVNKMLDQLPQEVFESTSTTFYDPSMGGGQFVVGVINRLRQYGHTDENISKRVFGSVEGQIRLNYILNTKDIVGTFKTKLIEDMKFDVIISNPPFNTSKGSDSQKNGSKMNKTTLYGEFINLAYNLQKKDGITAFIVPPAAFKKFFKIGFQIEISYFNPINIFGKSISTMTYFVTKGKKLPQQPNLQNKIFEHKKDRLQKRLSKDGLFPYNFIKPVRLLTKDEWSLLTPTRQNNFWYPLTLTPTELNHKNALFLMEYFSDYINGLTMSWSSVNKRLKFQWLEGLTHEITEEDIINQYDLTSEEIKIIKGDN